MLSALALAEKLGSTDLPILFLGERGTGKTVFAAYIHALSTRSGEFVKENLSGLPSELQYGALAGHVRGGFTGAQESRKGLMESAHLGTLLLDEIGLASAATQCLLLGLLDDGALRRLGEDRRRRLDVRLLFATNADLWGMAERKEFRADLLDRFGFQRITLPPLRERRDEIPALAELFVSQAAARWTPGHAPRLSTEVLECFHIAPWSGNIRELENACRFAVAVAGSSRTIEVEHLPAELDWEARPSVSAADDPDQKRVQEVLTLANGNKAEAARILHISRQRLYRLLAG